MKVKTEQVERVAGPLKRDDWDFGDVPNQELIACCYWEYARESAFVRDLRERSWQHWKPLSLKDRWWDAPEDKGIRADLLKVQSIGYPAEVFLRGISCPPDDVLPDAPPLKPGEVRRVTGSFPKPWQKLTKEERAYRSHIGSDALAPFERGDSMDAKDIRAWIEARRAETNAANDRVRRENRQKTEEALCREGKLHFPTIQPSLHWASGKEVTVVGIQWARFTDGEIVKHFRGWVKLNRPANIPAPNAQGRKMRDWRVALNRLGTMRVLHVHTFADYHFPKAFKDHGEKQCYAARKGALKKFCELFPFLPKGEKPINWTTKGRPYQRP
jgi:GR25 family glycosyltransferase involved in LPS biosynthesis